MPDRTQPLTVGEPAPWFTCRSPSNPRYGFSTVAGRFVVLCFLGSAADADSRTLLHAIQEQQALFDPEHILLFNLSSDPQDEMQGRLADGASGIRVFWDFDHAVARQFGLVAPGGEGGGALRKMVYVMDLRLRVLTVIPLQTDASQCVERLMQVLHSLPPVGKPRMANSQAPVLVLPRVFSPELCRTLIRTYAQQGGEPSGFMRDVQGKTVLVNDTSHKQRRDCLLQDETLQETCVGAIRARLLPQLQNAFQFSATHMERHMVACYDAQEGGHFRPHRDNTTLGTAHRRFAVSLFLNTGDYEGGLLRFPEFGPALFSAPTGGAVVFSCSLQHEATPVTQGRRYMYLPFLYDEAAAQVMLRNRQYLQAGGQDEDAAPADSPLAGPQGQ
ncbi:2OG-Fe(II) oxygenase [Polaromonas sp.]|uniref:2OG-Fe(II) oxygenase n=1 Tax=Polaromonas sp. TaxID=1869339 RepID=UPI00286CC308|nr:2OG-Fe(II) oxygenase [Polaromonas sp.]